MSKDKGQKNVKKEKSATGKSSTSDYQAGKKSASTTDAGGKKK